MNSLSMHYVFSAEARGAYNDVRRALARAKYLLEEAVYYGQKGHDALAVDYFNQAMDALSWAEFCRKQARQIRARATEARKAFDDEMRFRAIQREAAEGRARQIANGTLIVLDLREILAAAEPGSTTCDRSAGDPPSRSRSRS